jgi:hypothetical protein
MLLKMMELLLLVNQDMDEFILMVIMALLLLEIMWKVFQVQE